MLPAEHRLRASADFAHVIKTGRRAGRSTLVLHLASRRSDGVSDSCASVVPAVSSRFGLVVGKSVGNSVIRHRVSRRLRAQLALRASRVPTSMDVVVRAQPGAATATSRKLGADLESALVRLLGAPAARS
ncbi:MAG: rnpA [Pseudonocardiales bacterium]|nr:rnpA [Pseudonocardiales bacterium]